MTGTEPSAPRTPFDRPLPVLALYAAATVALTFPLAFRIGTHLPLSEGDLWIGVWNLWWWKTALLELGTSPFHTAYLFHPVGASLASHAHSPLHALALLPVTAALGPAAAYDVALLLGFLLAGFCTWLLVRHLTGDGRAAFLAGLLFSFHPMRFEAGLEGFDVAGVQFLPLFALFTLRLCERPGAGAALALALAWAANALVHWYWGVVAVLLGAPLVAFELWRGRARGGPDRSDFPDRRGFPDRPEARRVLGWGAAAAALGAALAAPFAWPLLQAAGDTAASGRAYFYGFGVDPGFWLVPSENHPLLGGIVAGFRAGHVAYTNVDLHGYLGFTPLALAALAAARPAWGGRRRGLWLALFAAFLVLALGAHPVLFGRELTGLALPQALFAYVPVLDRLRFANRLELVAFLPLALLVGLALAGLFREGRERLAWGLGALLVFEMLWLPYPLQPAATHPALAALSSDPAAGAVLPIPLPLSHEHSRALLDQTAHGRPILGGYVSYYPEAPLREITSDPFLAGLVVWPPRPRPVNPRHLAHLGVGTVVVHLDRRDSAKRARMAALRADYYGLRALGQSGEFPDAALQRVRRHLRRALGPPAYRDPHLEIYRVDEGDGLTSVDERDTHLSATR